ncbi:MAG: NAD-binding protein [Anaerolineae bacterium]|nr:NAD-binding protein [Anaerolineae bacterium]
MFVIIAGGGRTGTQLAALLQTQNHQVHVVEGRTNVLARAHREVPTEVIFEGHPTDLQTLEQAGIRQADAVAACTSDDANNLAICFLARTVFKVPRTIARINYPRNAWLFDRKFHVDVALNSPEIMASLIEEEMSMGEMITLLKLRRGHYSLVEEKIPAGSNVIGVPLKDLSLPEQCVIAAIIRQGQIVVPKGSTGFEADDEVLAITDRPEELAALFAPQSAG